LIKQTSDKPKKLKQSYHLIQQHLTAINKSQDEQQLFDQSKEGVIKIKKDLICIYNEVLLSAIK
jgi:hypothetical protein